MLHGERRNHGCQDRGITRRVFSTFISIFLVLREDNMSGAKTVAILGAGPVGLAAAAHALERGLEPIVLEAGPTAGHAVRQWSHVRMFSSWQHNIDRASRRLLDAAGWNAPPAADFPTG